MDTRYNPYPRELVVPLCRPPALTIDRAIDWAAACGDAPGRPGSARDTLRALRCELGRQLRCEPERVVPTTSGRAALSLALHALSLAKLDASAGPLQGHHRDEVVVPSFGCPQVIEAVLDVGLTPVLCDTAPDRPVPNLAAIEAAASERCLAVVAASVLGDRVELEAIEAWAEGAGVAVIDDAAQAFAGATTSGRCPGAGGQLGVLSFGRHKPVCVGEGGALVVNELGISPFVQIAREQLDLRWRGSTFARARAEGPASPRPWFTDVA
ncbi:DegT/DnrJ/EryC1/StrS family aminotransferase, partial [Enhygromyxa salina]|uniref:DegT/DnrJ/EryC1/StrS family aminotransferase n=1 Tax=Enhygromyxa salina TaxID=215803 RepID=UPI0015E6206F